MEQRDRIIVVTGASSGIGNACATYLAKRGHRVYGTCRTPSAFIKKADEFFEMIPLDMTTSASIERAITSILEKEGHIDVLVCNAGIGIAGSIEETTEDEIALQMNTNLMGTIRCVKTVLPAMRQRGQGKIIVISSIAGLIGMPFQAFYSASKFALEGFVESLRYETRSFGIQSCLIEPGDFHTGFTKARQIIAVYAKNPAASPYRALCEAALGIQIRDETSGADPLLVARLVHNLIGYKRLSIRYTVGPAFQRFAAFAKRIMPERLIELAFRKVYKLP